MIQEVIKRELHFYPIGKLIIQSVEKHPHTGVQDR